MYKFHNIHQAFYISVFLDANTVQSTVKAGASKHNYKIYMIGNFGVKCEWAESTKPIFQPDGPLGLPELPVFRVHTNL